MNEPQTDRKKVITMDLTRRNIMAPKGGYPDVDLVDKKIAKEVIAVLRKHDLDYESQVSILFFVDRTLADELIHCHRGTGRV
ncbi:hypothetical protein [Lacticaseibacillus mingshuiensis]|uniref:Uncharacterized protein n=1 Tax=Lacticaseibacillus mingshuiensis TaxID=2799574 RepID=A0ABW4CJH1_9LACO|nr:hypothetical protein [Lacticaseibacillus mingshuiensis]